MLVCAYPNLRAKGFGILQENSIVKTIGLDFIAYGASRGIDDALPRACFTKVNINSMSIE